MKEYKTDVERFREITQNLVDLYEKKNANYGNSFEKLFNELEKISTKKNEQYIYLVYSMYMDCMWWNIINYEFKDKK